MFEWRQEPCQFRDITDKVSLPKVTRNQTKLLSLKRKRTRKNRHASGLNENGSILLKKQFPHKLASRSNIFKINVNFLAVTNNVELILKMFSSYTGKYVMVIFI